MCMRGKSHYREFVESLRVGTQVSISGGSRVIIEDLSKGSEDVKVLDESIKGRIKGFLFGRVLIEIRKNVIVTAHPTSLFK